MALATRAIVSFSWRTGRGRSEACAAFVCGGEDGYHARPAGTPPGSRQAAFRRGCDPADALPAASF
jgi:hypothetical protein